MPLSQPSVVCQIVIGPIWASTRQWRHLQPRCCEGDLGNRFDAAIAVAVIRHARRLNRLVYIDLHHKTGLHPSVWTRVCRYGEIPRRLSTARTMAEAVGADWITVEAVLHAILPELRAARHPIVDELEQVMLPWASVQQENIVLHE